MKIHNFVMQSKWRDSYIHEQEQSRARRVGREFGEEKTKVHNDGSLGCGQVYLISKTMPIRHHYIIFADYDQYQRYHQLGDLGKLYTKYN